MSKSLKMPYIQKVAERGSFKIWMVDGSFIRGHVDEEFTNFGQHYRHLHIPLNELWIDQEAEPDERQFLIDPLLVEHRLMAKGMPYEKALVEADRAERKERRRAGDVRRLTQHGQKLPDGREVHERMWKKLENGLTGWIVNGYLVHSVFDIDFTAGGHDDVYEFVPQNEI